MIEIVIDPGGEVYKALVALALRECASFSLVMRRIGLKFDQTAEKMSASLAQHLISEQDSSSWPGTNLLGDTATVRKYRLDQESATKLLGVDSLYAWRAPAYPEDLAFYRDDDVVWLGSISHEEFGFFDNPRHTLHEIRKFVPGLVIREVSDGT